MDIIKRIYEKRPLVHCITNTVTVNDCANALLAIGARPVMAEHPLEAAQFTANADALLVNTGTIYESKMEAMRISARAARDNAVPLVLDCVGVMSSAPRRDLAMELIEICTPAVIKGNAAEIKAVTDGVMCGGGVDSDAEADTESAVRAARDLGSVIMVTGRSDFITDGSVSERVTGGTEKLTRITGAGCILGCITAAMAACTDPLSAAKYAAAVMSGCARRADNGCGTATFKIRLIDELSRPA